MLTIRCPHLSLTNNRSFLRVRTQTYGETAERVTKLGSALVAAGASAGSKVGILSPNTCEWMELLLANASQSCVTIPLYDTLGADVIEYIIDHAECEVVAINTGSKQLASFIGAMPKVTSKVKVVVLFGKEDHGAAKAKVEEAAAGTAGFADAKVFTYAEFLDLGASNPAAPTPPKKEDLAVIMYTSGTTGNPKGVMLLHDTYMYEVGGAQAFLKTFVELGEDDTFFSFLPLAHIFDQVVELMFIGLGAHIGYWRGDVKKLVDDVGVCKPTLFAGVPRIYDKIYNGAMGKFSKAPLSWLYNWAKGRKLYFMEEGMQSYKTASPMADGIVFKKVAKKLGGRVKAICSGAAPLARHVEDFLRVGMCASVSQGYGLTETCAASCIAPPDYPGPNMAGTVGVITPAIQMCLDAVPEMKYLPTNDPPAGEVCFKGPAVFQGYYKQQELTDEVLEKDGWFHTGDIGIITPEGALKIVDRKKNIFKLSQGEYVAVEKLENEYGKCTDFDAIWVYGNSFESTLVGVVCPNEDKLKKWASENGVSGDFAALCASDAAKKHMLALLKETAKGAKLKGFERIAAVHLEPEPWTPDDGRELLTPTFKKKRPQLLKMYQAQIDDMYKQINRAGDAR